MRRPTLILGLTLAVGIAFGAFGQRFLSAQQPSIKRTELNRPAGGLLVIDVSEYQPFRTTGRTAIERFLHRRPEGNVIAFLRDPIVAHLTHMYPA